MSVPSCAERWSDDKSGWVGGLLPGGVVEGREVEMLGSLLGSVCSELHACFSLKCFLPQGPCSFMNK